MKKYILFGATGFIGSHVAEAFQLAGRQLTAVVRRGSKTDYLQSLGISMIEQEDFGVPALTELLKGFAVVINCTANVHPHQSMRQYNRVQVELTEHIARAAAAAGCERLLQLSSVQVYGSGPSSQPLQEQAPCRPLFDFQRSLLDREIVLQSVAEETGLDIVVLRPAGTFGPRSSFVEMIMKSVEKGQFPVIGEGDSISSAVDTRDIGRAMVFLADKPEAGGQVYNLQAYAFSMQSLKRSLEFAAKRPLKFQRLPSVVASFLARLMVVFTPYGKVPMLTPFIVHAAISSLRIDGRKLRALGFTSRYSMEDTVEYLLASGSGEKADEQRQAGHA